MTKVGKTLNRVLRGTADANLSFEDLCALLRHLGFAERVRGSHRIFTRDGIPEILNLQPRGSEAKPYQVKQVRETIVTHRLAGQTRGQLPDERAELSTERSNLSTPEEEDNG